MTHTGFGERIDSSPPQQASAGDEQMLLQEKQTSISKCSPSNQRAASWQQTLAMALIFIFLITLYTWQPASADSTSNQPTAKGSPASQGNSSVQLFLPPVLEKGSAAWGSAFLPDGDGLAKHPVLINGKKVETDEYGLFNFTAPDTAFSIAIEDEGKPVWETNYTLSERGLLVSDKAAVGQVDGLDELEDEFNKQPIIMHAPAALEAQQAFVIVGTNFSGKFGHDAVSVDGFECDAFAGSARSLVIATRNRIPVGPVKEISIARDDESSLPLEVDITRVELRDQNKTATGSALDLELVGTNLPSLVAVSNRNTDTQLRFGGRRLGAQSIFLSPGGQPNRITVGIDNKDLTDVSAHIIANSLFDPYTQKLSSDLLGRKPLMAVNKAEIVRIKRRLLGLEERITLLNKQRAEKAKQKDYTAEEDAKLDSAVKAASIRISRLMRSLRSRRAILDADGMSEQEWAQLNDAAMDHMSRSLDTILAKNEFGFTESRLVRSSPSKKKAEQDQYAQLTSTPQNGLLRAANGTPRSGTRTRTSRWKNSTTSGENGGRLVAPPAPYRFDPADLAPYFSDEMPDPIKPITKRTPRARTRGQRSSAKSKSHTASPQRSKQQNKQTATMKKTRSKKQTRK